MSQVHVEGVQTSRVHGAGRGSTRRLVFCWEHAVGGKFFRGANVLSSVASVKD